ncbi:MAG: ABC transporter permease [Acidimicrobiia bacterium]|nr:ABC transporter permease [Acidimicrobiia bacterium]MDH4308226.1 ABC transporter permease [Acidimicrobiia bacterium]
MATFILRRILLSIPVLIISTVIIFWGMTEIADPLSSLRLLPNVSQQTIQNIVDRKHLDDPWYVQYVFWAKDLFTERNTTALGNNPIWPDLKRAAGNTVQLIAISEVIAITTAVWLGVQSAKKQYSVFDYTTTTVSFFGFSVPIFWFALMLQALVTGLFLWTGFRLFYTFGQSSFDIASQGWWAVLIDRLQHMVLPITTLAYVNIATYSRFQRASMLEVLNADYIRTARAKGLSERTVTMKHGLRNALIPVVTLAAINFGGLLGGAVITETIFAWPGMGKFFFDALSQGDAYTIMSWLVVTAIAIIIGNLLADIAYGWLDPRIRYD